MAKGSVWSETIEQLAEFSKATVKHTGKALKQTFSPIELAKKAINMDTKGNIAANQLEQAQGKKPNHTPLDFNKLGNSYQDQAKLKADNLRNRYFQRAKSEEEKTLQEKQREEVEKKRKEEFEKNENKRREQQQAQAQSQSTEPRGKERRNIFSHKKVAQREQAEVKPASGKQ